MTTEQTYQNHVRWYPLFHFIVVPLLFVNLIWQAVVLYQQPSWNQGEALLFAMTIVLLATAARLQALKAQDRVIRLEERLRYNNILPPDVTRRAADLPAGNLIALRFASDAELHELVGQVLDGKLTTSKEIKTAIKNWRGDYLRV